MNIYRAQLNKLEYFNFFGALLPKYCIFGKIDGIHYYITNKKIDNNKYIRFMYIYNNFDLKCHNGKRDKCHWEKVYINQYTSKLMKQAFIKVQSRLVPIMLDRYDELVTPRVEIASGINNDKPQISGMYRTIHSEYRAKPMNNNVITDTPAIATGVPSHVHVHKDKPIKVVDEETIKKVRELTWEHMTIEELAKACMTPRKTPIQ